MSFHITSGNTDAWEGFCKDPEVNIDFSYITVTNGGVSIQQAQCINNRFFPTSALTFSQALNLNRFGRPNAPGSNDDLLLLSLVPNPKFQAQSLSDILTQAGVLAGSVDTDSGTKSTTPFERVVSAFTATGIKFQLTENTLPPNTQPTFLQKRNAMWVTSGEQLQLDTVLAFTPEAPAGSLQNDILAVLPIKFSTMGSPQLIIQRRTIGIPSFQIPSSQDDDMADLTVAAKGSPTWHMRTTFRVTWEIVVESFMLSISWTSYGPEICLMPNNLDSSVQPASIWSSLKSLISGGLTDDYEPSSKDGGGDQDDFLDNINLLKVDIGNREDGSTLWEVMASITIPKHGPDVFLSYNSDTKSFTGGLILEGFYKTDEQKFLPDYEPGIDIDLPPAIDNTSVLASWNLRQYFNTAQVPDALPTDIIQALFYYSKPAVGSSVIHFDAQARHLATASTNRQSSVPTPFTWEALDVSFTKQGSNVQCQLSTLFKLSGPTGTSVTPANIGLTFTYDSTGWELRGQASNLSCSLLYSFFQPDCSNAAVEILGKLNIKYLDLMLTHTTAGKAASFLFTGVIDLGDLELRLFYQYVSDAATSTETSKIKNELDKKASDDKKPSPEVLPTPPAGSASWSFECDLGAATDKATIGSIVDSIIGGASSSLPSFVTNIPVPKADGTSGSSPISLKAKRIPVQSKAKQSTSTNGTNTDKPSSKIVFAFLVSIAQFSFTCIQISDVPSDVTAKALPTKRLIRFTASKIPMLDKVPLLDKLPQPFDLLEYVWVNDAGGFTQEELDLINGSGLLAPEFAIQYKQSSKTDASHDTPPRPDGAVSAKPSSNAGSAVLLPGHHFIVIHEKKVVLDHVFNASPATADQKAVSGDAKNPNLKAFAVASSGSNNDTTGEPAPDPSKPTKGALAFKSNLLSIDAISLQFKEQSGTKLLSVVMDATFTMGPISFSLLGFELALPLSSNITLNNLAAALSDIRVFLAGLAFSINKPPLLIAAGFEHTKTNEVETYMGGVGVSFPPYTFVGLGEYAIVTPTTGDPYKSVFLFAKLDGPLVTLEFATISGVRLGFGYNSYVRSPEIDELTQFPFIDDHSISGAGNDPMAILKKMTLPDPDANNQIWVKPQDKSYWFAAGMSVTAFDVLTITAVAMLAFRDSGLVASIYADAIATMPPDASVGTAIVYVEIGLMAELNFVDGYFRVEASLAPTSYLLVPACHLYGGFALVYWFPPNEHSGDWVFSIGGYHRAYTPPIWYPVPKRLGISFNIDIISVTGEAYFAVTPKCAMGGAMMHASLSVGPVDAWLDYVFDALVNFHPLHYDVEFSVSIGVRCSIDFLFVHIHITVHVGAELHIQGPEFGGSAYVDFYLFGFTVDFGASPRAPDPFNIHQFFLMLHKPGPDSSDNTAHKHDSPLLTYIKVESTNPDDELAGSNDAMTHQQKLLIDAISGAALKFVLADGNFPVPASADSSSSTGDPTSTGAGSKWFVKGGTFKFQINTDYVINDATLATPAATSAGPRHVDGLDSKQPLAPIASKAMQVTDTMSKSTTSTMAITVRRVITLNPLKYDDTPISTWKSFTFTSKPLPTGIWGPYDQSQDPSHVQRPPTLLDGTTDATTPHNIGVTLTAPPPVLCPKPEWPGFIPKFRATAAAKFAILDFHSTTQGDDWLKPDSLPEQTQFLPIPLTDKQKQESNLEKWTSTAAKWTKICSDADNLVNDPSTGLVSLMGTVLGWGEKRPQLTAGEEAAEVQRQKDTGLASWQLSGKSPRKMIENLEGVYLDLPQFC